MVRFVLLIMACFALTGCAQKPPVPILYSKNGGSEAEFLKDRFECIQQAQQGRSGSYVNQYGGSSYGTVVTSAPVFSACMSARGYAMGLTGTWQAPHGAMVMITD